MAKIVRKSQKIFGGDLTASGNVAVFGSLKAGSPSYSIDPATIQSAHYNLGWADAVVANNAPAIQDMNALFYVDTYQLAYLMQTGIAEWDAGTTYYIGSWCLDSVGIPYCSIVDTNLNNAVTDTTKWRRAVLTAPSGALNYGLTTSVAANALTINLVNNAGATPSSIAPAMFTSRSSTSSDGSYSVVNATVATSLVVPSGATLGISNAVDTYIYVYAIDNGGTIALGVSCKKFDDKTLVSTTAISGSSTSAEILYSTSALTSKACILIGRLKSNQTTSGTYAANVSEISLGSNFATGGIVGTVNGLSSPTGYVGELLTASNTQSVAASNVPFNVATISLTPGRWLVTGGLRTQSVASASGISNLISSVNTTSATLSSNGGEVVNMLSLSSSADAYLAGMIKVVNVSATSSAYLVGQINYSSAGSLALVGTINAVRIA